MQKSMFAALIVISVALAACASNVQPGESNNEVAMATTDAQLEASSEASVSDSGPETTAEAATPDAAPATDAAVTCGEPDFPHLVAPLNAWALSGRDGFTEGQLYELTITPVMNTVISDGTVWIFKELNGVYLNTGGIFGGELMNADMVEWLRCQAHRGTTVSLRVRFRVPSGQRFGLVVNLDASSFTRRNDVRLQFGGVRGSMTPEECHMSEGNFTLRACDEDGRCERVLPLGLEVVPTNRNSEGEERIPMCLATLAP